MTAPQVRLGSRGRIKSQGWTRNATGKEASYDFSKLVRRVSVQGKYADLLVLDRDYLTVAADSIKDIKPVLTLVGGKIVSGSASVSLARPFPLTQLRHDGAKIGFF